MYKRVKRYKRVKINIKDIKDLKHLKPIERLNKPKISTSYNQSYDRVPIKP